MLSMNQPMIKLAEKLGFTIADAPDDPTCRRATLPLEQPMGAR
jgi:hypothetical protein